MTAENEDSKNNELKDGDLSRLTAEQWKQFDEAIEYIERRIRRFRQLPDEAVSIYTSAWRTFLRRRQAVDLRYWKDVTADTANQLKLRLMFHVYRKVRRQRDLADSPQNQHQLISDIDRHLGIRFDPAGPAPGDDEKVLDALLEPCRNLSDRQRSIARLIALDRTEPKDIARELKISLHTVYRDIKKIQLALNDELNGTL